MLKIYIKNHVKMIFRKKWIIVLMVIFPLLLIAALSSVFGDLMERNLTLEEYTIGYSLEESADFPIEYLKQTFEENKIQVKEIKNDDKEKYFKDETIIAYLDITRDGYTIYKVSGHVIETSIIENICYMFFQQYKIPTINNEDITIKTQSLDLAPLPSSIDYYGIIEIVYFTWFGFMCLTSILSSERKNRILQRVQVTSASRITIYLAKFIPSVIISFMEMLIAMLLSHLIFGVHWGNLLLSSIIILLSIIAGITFSLMVFTLCKQLLVGIAINYVAGFVMGFIGGSFQMYMFSPFTENIKILSPIYHTNRALVELSTKGSSDYVSSCVCVLLIISVVFAGITILGMRRKEVLV